MDPLVYVVILNWNLKHDTAECVVSVLRSDYERLRVVVVDNASSDDSVPWLRVHFPTVPIIVHDRNAGYAGGNNLGIRYALDNNADYVLVLNNDTVVAPTTVRLLVEALETDSTLGIVAPRIYYYDEPARSCYLGDRCHAWAPVPLRVRDPGAAVMQVLEVDYVSGCAMMIRRAVLETVGFLDEVYFMYYEDSDFCRRMKAAEYRLACVTTARIWHKIARSSRQVRPIMAYYRGRNRVRFYTQYHHGPHPLLTVAYWIGRSVITIASDLVTGRGGQVRPFLRGLADGVRWVRDGVPPPRPLIEQP